MTSSSCVIRQIDSDVLRDQARTATPFPNVIIDDFFDAVDSDDVELATSLMKKARIDASTIAMVVRKMEDGDGEH